MKLTLENFKGWYRCRFTIAGKRYAVYYGTRDYATAVRLHRKLQNDVLNGTLNPDLKSYSLRYSLQVNTSPAQPRITLQQLWDKWVETLNLEPSVRHNHYHWTRTAIPEKALWYETAWFLKKSAEWSASTARPRLSAIRRCVDWGIATGLISGENPWRSVKLRCKRGQSRIKPFSRSEVQAIVRAFSEDTFCSKNANTKHSYYLPFVKFLFTYGTRLGEAIALTWDKVLWEDRLIVIEQTASRNLSQSPTTSSLILKETKTGEIHFLYLTPSMEKMLKEIKETSDSPYVFPGRRGGLIDINSFRKAWRRVLEGLGIPYRYPYQCRHTVLSYVAKVHGLPAAAELAGHKSLEMVTRHYAKFVGCQADIIPNLVEEDSG